MSKIKIKNEHLITEFLGKIISMIANKKSDRVVRTLDKHPGFKSLANKIQKDQEKHEKDMKQLLKKQPELKKDIDALKKKHSLNW